MIPTRQLIKMFHNKDFISEEDILNYYYSNFNENFSDNVTLYKLFHIEENKIQFLNDGFVSEKDVRNLQINKQDYFISKVVVESTDLDIEKSFVYNFNKDNKEIRWFLKENTTTPYIKEIFYQKDDVIKSFEDYKIVNEGIIDFFKNLTKIMFSGVKDVYSDQINQLYKGIKNKDNPKQVYGTLNKFLELNNKTFKKDVNNAKTLSELRDAIYSNVITLYTSFKTVSKKLSNDDITFQGVFGENPPKKLAKIFNTKKEKKRKRLILDFANELVKDMGSGLNIEDFSALETEVGKKQEEKKQEENSDEKQKEEIKNPQQASESLILEKISDDQLSDMKELITDWFTNNIYGRIDKNINTEEKQAKKASGDVDKLISTVDNTDNTKGLTAMIRQIIKLDDPKKYAKVRDTLAKMDFVNKKKIGKF